MTETITDTQLDAWEALVVNRRTPLHDFEWVELWAAVPALIAALREARADRSADFEHWWQGMVESGQLSESSAAFGDYAPEVRLLLKEAWNAGYKAADRG